ncbi:MAG TPA: hypothetical protein VFY16_04605 [Gemmatimonadaceae bacterium]|nr:hypothetical protein [Gemmatimonadaceae bacterium]
MACNDTPTTPTDIAGPSLARAHFIGDPSCTQVGSNLVCDFKVAGLGNVSEVDITVQAPFQCAKSTGGNLDVRPGGLASASQSNVPVTNGQITIENFVVSGGRRCPDGFAPDFGNTATLIINGVTLTIPIT